MTRRCGDERRKFGYKFIKPSLDRRAGGNRRRPLADDRRKRDVGPPFMDTRFRKEDGDDGATDV